MPQFRLCYRDYPPYGWRLATCAEVRDHLAAVEALLYGRDWGACRLADGKFIGVGWGFELYEGRCADLGPMIVVRD